MHNGFPELLAVVAQLAHHASKVSNSPVALASAAVIVGCTVGLTGMGGGALMTPILVLLFKITPSTAVSSDLLASLVMKPIGGGVHLKRGTINWSLVRWLCIGSVPSAFAGGVILKSLGFRKQIQQELTGLLRL